MGPETKASRRGPARPAPRLRHNHARDHTMQARMKNPVLLVPDAMRTLHALDKSTEKQLPFGLRKLVHLRASQINGCSVCVDMHSRELKKAGETDERIFTVSAWRETPYFTEAERAALALTEEVTRLSDRPDAVPDVTWDAAAHHYDEQALAALIIQIGLINVWNRFNATRQAGGRRVEALSATHRPEGEYRCQVRRRCLWTGEAWRRSLLPLTPVRRGGTAGNTAGSSH